MIQIAFGTTHYPKDPTKLHTFIDELIVSGTPFLWSHASPLAKVPEEVDAKIAGYERGLHANWIPQRAVLRHPATGWFVSHGGWNSLQEALSLRVPLFVLLCPIVLWNADARAALCGRSSAISHPMPRC
jgi:hypothetical protein